MSSTAERKATSHRHLLGGVRKDVEARNGRVSRTRTHSSYIWSASVWHAFFSVSDINNNLQVYLFHSRCLVIAVMCYYCDVMCSLVDLFNTIPTIPIMIVSPCCSPRVKKKASANIKMKATLKNNSWDNYSFWCLNVFTAIDRLNVCKDIIDDKDVESDKSKIIIAVKTIINE